MSLILQAVVSGGEKDLCGCEFNYVATIHDEHGIALRAEITKPCEYHELVTDERSCIDGFKLINC